MARRIALASLIFVLSFSALSSAASTGVWNGYASTLAFGSVNGVSISAFSTNTSPFVGIVDGRFSDGEGGGWDAPLALNSSIGALVASNVNGGDVQDFHFAKPIEEGLLYIENFDSNSIAHVTATGADWVELVSASPSISYTPLTDATGTLATSNATYNGEGDAVLLFSGEVTGIRLGYSRGDGANGVFYGFAVGSVRAVPEPSSNVWVAICLIASFAFRRRRLGR